MLPAKLQNFIEASLLKLQDLPCIEQPSFHIHCAWQPGDLVYLLCRPGQHQPTPSLNSMSLRDAVSHAIPLASMPAAPALSMLVVTL